MLSLDGRRNFTPAEGRGRKPRPTENRGMGRNSTPTVFRGRKLCPAKDRNLPKDRGKLSHHQQGLCVFDPGGPRDCSVMWQQPGHSVGAVVLHRTAVAQTTGRGPVC